MTFTQRARKADNPMTGIPEYPDVDVQLTGENGNVFNIIGRVAKALRNAGHRDQVEAFTKAAFSCGSYEEVLQLCMVTVNVR